MNDLVVLIPVLGRPHHIEPMLESLYKTTKSVTPLFLTSEFDIEPRDEIKRLGERFVDVRHRTKGDYARKINAGYKLSKEPLIFLGATDIKFHPKWFENAQRKLNKKVQVVGTNDLGNPFVMAGEHSTHTLVTRSYIDHYGTIDEPDKILHEGYIHEWVDNEFVGTAKHRKAWAMAMDSIVEHLHPIWGKGRWDAGYRETDKRVRRGSRYYKTRSVLWT